ncbi:MAG: hypothetical protein KRP56_07155 [Candidatus Methanogranum gryphiswaldense]|nr:MAG: hypothetical protein KRP56_07155 [Candidatus Methanogranum sp. U3.2.1]
MDDIPVKYWTWTAKVCVIGSKKALFLPSEAVRNMKITPMDGMYVEIQTEKIFDEEISRSWTSKPIVRGKQMIVEIPIDAVNMLNISYKDILHIRIEIDDSTRFWTSIKKIRLYGDSDPGFDRELLGKFIEDNDIVYFSRGLAYTGIKGYKKNSNGENIPPNIDHKSSFMNINGDIIVVYHPYHPLDIKREEAWGKENGLKVKVYGKEYSWYFSYHTYCVVITAEDFDVKMSKTERTEEEVKSAVMLR